MSKRYHCRYLLLITELFSLILGVFFHFCFFNPLPLSTVATRHGVIFLSFGCLIIIYLFSLVNVFIRDVYEILRSNLHFIYICHDRLLQLVTELFLFYDVLRSSLLFKYILSRTTVATCHGVIFLGYGCFIIIYLFFPGKRVHDDFLWRSSK